MAQQRLSRWVTPPEVLRSAQPQPHDVEATNGKGGRQNNISEAGTEIAPLWHVLPPHSGCKIINEM